MHSPKRTERQPRGCLQCSQTIQRAPLATFQLSQTRQQPSFGTLREPKFCRARLVQQFAVITNDRASLAPRFAMFKKRSATFARRFLVFTKYPTRLARHIADIANRATSLVRHFLLSENCRAKVARPFFGSCKAPCNNRRRLCESSRLPNESRWPVNRIQMHRYGSAQHPRPLEYAFRLPPTGSRSIPPPANLPSDHVWLRGWL